MVNRQFLQAALQAFPVLVIIEGAQRILEAHTTAVLTTNVEHLILIGQSQLCF